MDTAKANLITLLMRLTYVLEDAASPCNNTRTSHEAAPELTKISQAHYSDTDLSSSTFCASRGAAPQVAQSHLHTEGTWVDSRHR